MKFSLCLCFTAQILQPQREKVPTLSKVPRQKNTCTQNNSQQSAETKKDTRTKIYWSMVHIIDCQDQGMGYVQTVTGWGRHLVGVWSGSHWNLFVMVDALQKRGEVFVVVLTPLQMGVVTWGGACRHDDGSLVVVCSPYSVLGFDVLWEPVPAGYQSIVGVVIGGVYSQHSSTEAQC